MEVMIEFGRGPLFRFAISIAILGLLRHVFISLVGLYRTRKRAGDKRLEIGTVIKDTLVRLNPLRYFVRNRFLYSIFSVSFHLGVLLVPIFYLGHIRLWQKGLGASWPAIPGESADILTIVTIATALLLFAGRAWTVTSRTISRPQDWLLPPSIALVFFSGFLLAHPAVFPDWLSLDFVFVVHVWLADIILLATPFTKIAHCALLPFSQFASEMAWRMVPGAGRDIVKTIGKEGEPI